MTKFDDVRRWLIAAMISRFECPKRIFASKVNQASPSTPARQSLPRTEVEITQVARSIGLAIPDACMPGVVANLVLLDGHAAVLSGRAPGVAS